jgi:hypothetical protein
MESRWFERLAMAAVFATAAAMALAQDPPTPPVPPQDPPAEEEEKPAKLNWFSFGTYGYDFSGNRQVFRRYASGPGNFSIRELRLFSPNTEEHPWARFTMRGSLWEDSASEAYLIFGGGKFTARGHFNKYDFSEASPFVLEDSNERWWDAMLTYAITPKIGAFFNYDAGDHFNRLESPNYPYSFRTKAFSGGLQGEILGANAAVTYVDRRYYDRMGMVPDSIQKQILAQVGIPIGDSFNIGAAYADVRIELNNGSDNKIRNWALNADWEIGPDTTLLFDARRTDYDLTQVLNAYVQEEFVTGGRLVHHFPGASFQFGYKRREAERLRRDQSFVDVPKWDIFDGRISARLGKALRLTAKGSFEHMRDGATMQMDEDSRALYWDDRVKGEVKLDLGGEKLSGYAVYRYRFTQNDDRATEITNHNWTVGASYAFTDQMSAWMEIANDTFEVEGFGEDGLFLDDFFPSSVSVAFGFDWAITPRDSFGLALNHYYMRNANPLRLPDGNIRGTEITGVYRREINADSSFDITVAPWRYRDRLFEQMDYRATVLGVNYTVKF